MSAIDVVIMAAGKGTRMKSQRPKVLHRLAGRPLLGHVLDSAAALRARSAVVITGHGAAEVEAFCADWTGAAGRKSTEIQLRPVRQEPQLGTGHAVQQAVPMLPDDGLTLILNGDVPLVRTETMRRLIALCGKDQIAHDAAVGRGRVVHRHGRIVTRRIAGMGRMDCMRGALLAGGHGHRRRQMRPLERMRQCPPARQQAQHDKGDPALDHGARSLRPATAHPRVQRRCDTVSMAPCARPTCPRSSA